MQTASPAACHRVDQIRLSCCNHAEWKRPRSPSSLASLGKVGNSPYIVLVTTWAWGGISCFSMISTPDLANLQKKSHFALHIARRALTYCSWADRVCLCVKKRRKHYAYAVGVVVRMLIGRRLPSLRTAGCLDRQHMNHERRGSVGDRPVGWVPI